MGERGGSTVWIPGKFWVGKKGKKGIDEL